ncbi:MAG: AAA family ATPase [Candidatus Pacearchaeota archaeon]|jgi:RecA-family ATPase
MKVYIPKQLIEIEHTRFIVLEGKRPLSTAWTLNPQYYEQQEDGSWKHKVGGEFYKVKGEVYYGDVTNYSYNDEELQKSIDSEWNIGFLTGSGEVEVLDIDKKELKEWAVKNLPPTFIIKTGGDEEHEHWYYRRKGENQKILFEKEGVHFGEWMAAGQQVVLCGSEHPKTKKSYTILNDIPIAEITEEHIELLKEEFTDRGRTFTIQSPDWSKYKDLSNIKIESLLPYLKELKKYGVEFYGSHPTHGSTTGMNFFINIPKNLWHCFRHDSGGDALALISILEGICNCEDFRKDGKKLRGESFKKTIEIAKTKYHFDIKSKEYTEVKTLRPSFEIKVISAKELSNMDIPVPSWIIENLVPEEGLVIVAGKTASMKSFLSTTMGICSNYGKDFLGKFKTTKGIWLYFDEENPLRLTKDRNEKIMEGLEVEAPEDFKYVCHSGIKLDNEEHLQVLEEIIDRYKPSVVVFDSLVRFLDHTDENNAGEISNIFTKLRRLTSIYKTTFLIIHHMRKSSKEKGHEDQDEGVRGSTDIVNAVDCLLLISRKDKSSPFINVKQEKNRFDKEIEPFVILIKQNEDNKGVSFEIAANTEQELSIADKAANEILTWLREEKEWEDKNNKVFKTAEIIERFSGVFNKKFDRNRKIINEALTILNVRERIKRTESKGYYIFVDMIEFDIKEVKDEEDDEDGS